MDVQLPCLSAGKNGRTEDWHTIYHHLRIGCEPGWSLCFFNRPVVPSKSSKMPTEPGKLLSSKIKSMFKLPKGKYVRIRIYQGVYVGICWDELPTSLRYHNPSQLWWLHSAPFPKWWLHHSPSTIVKKQNISIMTWDSIIKSTVHSQLKKNPHSLVVSLLWSRNICSLLVAPRGICVFNGFQVLLYWPMIAGMSSSLRGITNNIWI